MKLNEFKELCKNLKDAEVIPDHENMNLESIEKPLTVEGLRESVKKFRQFMGYRDFQLYVFIKDDVDGNEDK